MALNMDAIGKKIGPLKKDYDWKDVVLYALGVGAGFDELDYTYEKNLKVIPSFSIAAIFDFLGQVGAASNMNLAGILHGEQELIFHNPIPTSGTLITEGRSPTTTTRGQRGPSSSARATPSIPTARSSSRTSSRSSPAWTAASADQTAPPNIVEFPEREPDFSVDAAPSPNQPLIYRLSGDIFQLHVDPEFAKMVGFEKPIMHGLCTHGFACRALMASLTPGRPELVRRLRLPLLQAPLPRRSDPDADLEDRRGKGRLADDQHPDRRDGHRQRRLRIRRDPEGRDPVRRKGGDHHRRGRRPRPGLRPGVRQAGREGRRQRPRRRPGRLGRGIEDPGPEGRGGDQGRWRRGGRELRQRRHPRGGREDREGRPRRLRDGGYPHQQRRDPPGQEPPQDGAGNLAGGPRRPPERRLPRDANRPSPS